MLYMTTTKWAT